MSALLKPKNERPTGPARTLYLGCPMTRYKATWCRYLCEPEKGRGHCGQLAPQAMRSRIQRAIARQQAEAPIERDSDR